jgi:hypothetical protein
LARRIAWNALAHIHSGLLANVGEHLIHLTPTEFHGVVAAWSAVAVELPLPIQIYAQVVIGEAQRQWAGRPKKDFDVNELDRVIDVAVRGLQPSDVKMALAALPDRGAALHPLLQETLRMLEETIDIQSATGA